MRNPLNLIKGSLTGDDDNVVHLFEGDEVKQAKIELWIAKTLGAELHKYYPTRAWTVGVDIDAHVAVIKLPEISLANGYVLSLQRSMQDLVAQMKQVGGHILERGGVSRAVKHDSDDIEALDRDFKDTVVGESVEAPEEEHKRKGDEAVAARVLAARVIAAVKRGDSDVE